jgi:hypothetical protein
MTPERTEQSRSTDLHSALMVTVEFRGVVFQLRAEEAEALAEALALTRVPDGNSMTITEAAAKGGWDRVFGVPLMKGAGASAGLHRLANALADAYKPGFDAGPNAYHRKRQ